MACTRYHDKEGQCVAVVCTGGLLYDFGGHLFELHSYFGPIPLRRDNHDPRVRIPPGFWPAWERFEKLSPEQQELCRVEE